MNVDQVRESTRTDPVLSRVLQYVMTGWPDKQITPEITLYFSKRHEITVEDSCLLWGVRVIITHWTPRYCPYEVTRATSRLVA